MSCTTDPIAGCMVGDPCSAAGPPIYSSDPVTTWTCPQGTYIIAVNAASDNNSIPGFVGQFGGISCSDGSVVSGCAGECPTAIGSSGNASCATDGAGIIGFSGLAGAALNRIDFYCGMTGDKAPWEPSDPFTSSGGTPFCEISCPVATHRAVGLSFTTSTYNSSSGTKKEASTPTIMCQPLNEYCVGNALLTDPACHAFCSSSDALSGGLCNTALLELCSQSQNYGKSICGCALPASQYPILNLTTTNGASIPIACDARCQNALAIPLSNSGTCNIGVICVQASNEVALAQSTVGKGITISQSCGNTTSPTSSSSFFTSTTFYLILGLVLLIVLVIVVLLIVSSASARKKKQKANEEELERQESIIQQAPARAPSSRPTIIRVQ
jgi:hypothetical protein